MSSTGNSPHRFSGSADAFYDPDFTADISKKMRVPERIVIETDKDNNYRSAGRDQNYVNGFDDPAIIAAKRLANSGSDSSDQKPMWMTVPERILVMGNDSHMSGREQLPEMKLENSMIGMSGDYISEIESLQLSTPPRTLKLSEYTFPTVDDNQSSAQTNGPALKSLNIKKKRNIALSGFANTSTAEEVLLDHNRKDSPESPDYQSFYNSNISVSDMSEEALLLRRQLKAMSRRVAAIELENQHRRQREVIVYTIGVIYFLIKGVFWIQKRL